MNVEQLEEFELDNYTIVTEDNVTIGRRVLPGKHWNTKKWRSRNCVGVIIGFTNENGTLFGQNAPKIHNQVRMGLPNWCVVQWENDGISVYPIGSDGVFSLAFADDG